MMGIPSVFSLTEILEDIIPNLFLEIFLLLVGDIFSMLDLN